MRQRLDTRAALTALAILSAPIGAAGQPGPDPSTVRATAEAVAEVVAEPVEVGAVFELEVRVDHPAGAEAAPVLEDALGPFRVFAVAPVDSGEDAPGESRFLIRLGAFVLPGDHEIPAVPVGLSLPGGELAMLETPPAPVRVVSSLPADAEAGDIHDIRGPFEVRVPPRWGRLALVGLALLAVVAGLWLWLRHRARRLEPAPPPVPAAVEAAAALARLRAAGLLETGHVTAFYERLAGIMKRYAGRRFATRWSERTTGEILSDLEARSEPDLAGSLPLLATVLSEADLAKFSEQSFRPDTAEARLDDAGRFLERTRPQAAPDSGSSPEAPPA